MQTCQHCIYHLLFIYLVFFQHLFSKTLCTCTLSQSKSASPAYYSTIELPLWICLHICERRTLSHSYTLRCKCCLRNVHRNCTQFSHHEFEMVDTDTPWYCRLCNENIFAFNHIDDDSEFVSAIRNFMSSSLWHDGLDRFQGTEIFDPFELNDDDSDKIIEYQGELDPDKNYFNQLAHHLSKSSNYYIEKSFNKYIERNNVNKEDCSIMHVNIRSIPANFNNFLSYMSNIDHSFSVIVFSETWLTPANIDACSIVGYNHVGLTRDDRKGGGVSLLISEKLMYTEFQELNIVEDYIECVFVKIMDKGNVIIVGTVYRPPNSNIVEFNDTMSNILEKIGHHSCYIMSDCNLDLLKHDKHPLTENFLDVMYAHSFIPVINRPTRVTMNTFTLIDNIFTNHHDVKEHQLHGILKTDITDHFPLFHCNRGKKSPNVIDDEYKLIRIINEARTMRYVSIIHDMDWSFLDSFGQCQSYFSNFLRVFKKIYEESFPLTRVKIRYRKSITLVIWWLKGINWT